VLSADAAVGGSSGRRSGPGCGITVSACDVPSSEASSPANERSTTTSSAGMAVATFAVGGRSERESHCHADVSEANGRTCSAPELPEGRCARFCSVASACSGESSGSGAPTLLSSDAAAESEDDAAPARLDSSDSPCSDGERASSGVPRTARDAGAEPVASAVGQIKSGEAVSTAGALADSARPASLTIGSRAPKSGRSGTLPLPSVARRPRRSSRSGTKSATPRAVVARAGRTNCAASSGHVSPMRRRGRQRLLRPRRRAARACRRVRGSVEPFGSRVRSPPSAPFVRTRR